MMPETRKCILVAPLEWGLGHTARSVRIIDHCLALGHRVILATDGLSLRFLRFRFPELPWVRMPFHEVRYPAGSHLVRHLILQTPAIIRSIRSNRRQLAIIIREHGVDVVISDHRYGMHHPSVTSVFVTSQLWLRAPAGWRWGEGLVYRLHRFVLRKFHHIWIADFPGRPNISGLLTHPARLPANARYILPVSRLLQVVPQQPANTDPPEVLAILSGPEPQRTLLEEKLTRLLGDSGIPSVILRGWPPADPATGPEQHRAGSVMLVSHAADPQLAWYLLHAGKVICRPGISNLSDLATLGRTALLIPTPGQTEQEYPAQHLEDQGFFMCCTQVGLTADIIRRFNPKSHPRFPEITGKELGQAIGELLKG